MESSQQITTLSFFRYKGFLQKIWAFFMMQFAHRHLSGVKGQRFYRLMGSGKGMGFNPWPDWSVYALLQVWDSEEEADHFHQNSKLMQAYGRKVRESWVLYMRNIKAHGEWGGSNPFQTVKEDPGNPLIAVITRATLKKKTLWKFWKYVPTSEKPLINNPGLIYTKGIGEVPVVHMATFSIWKDQQSLKDFAYGSKEHARAIKMTRELGWYSEELFSRFQPFKCRGSWQGIDLGLK